MLLTKVGLNMDCLNLDRLNLDLKDYWIMRRRIYCLYCGLSRNLRSLCILRGYKVI